jgi:predicted DsbA family dithiol-disulfide isomerase
METRGVDETTTMAVAERIGLDVEQLKVDMEAPEVAAVIEGNMQLASALGIQGTPAFVVDDQMIPGAIGHEALAQVIGEVREAGGCTIC